MPQPQNRLIFSFFMILLVVVFLREAGRRFAAGMVASGRVDMVPEGIFGPKSSRLRSAERMGDEHRGIARSGDGLRPTTARHRRRGRRGVGRRVR